MNFIDNILNKAISALARLKSKEVIKTVPDLVYTNQFPEYNKYIIGNWTYGRPVVLDWGDGSSLVIGKFCSIAVDVKILLGGEHHYDYVSTYPFNKLFLNDLPNAIKDRRTKGDVIIGHDVWIGRDVLIMSGVKIGNGAVIGAGAIVSKDVPSYAIVAGNPAKIIKYRFDTDTIEKLNELSWWNWKDEVIENNVASLMNSPQIFLKTTVQ
jgi:virginiamycin A acetyltransferase